MPKVKLGDLMVQAKLIDELQLNAALSHQRRWGGRLGDILIELNFLDEMMLYRGLSHQLGVPLVSLVKLEFKPELRSVVDLKTVNDHSVFPYEMDERSLTLATAEPHRVDILDDIAFAAQRRLKIVLAPIREIHWAIGRHYQGLTHSCPPPKMKRKQRAEAFVLVPYAEDIHDTLDNRAVSLDDDVGPLELESAAAAVNRRESRRAVPVGEDYEPSDPADRLRHKLFTAEQALDFLIDVCVDHGWFTRRQLFARLDRLSTSAKR